MHGDGRQQPPDEGRIEFADGEGSGIGAAAGGRQAKRIGRLVTSGESGEKAGEEAIAATDRITHTDRRRLGAPGDGIVEEDGSRRAEGDHHPPRALRPHAAGGGEGVGDAADGTA